MALKPVVATLTVTTAGTRVQCSSTNLYVQQVRFEADGTSVIYVGDSAVASTIYAAKITGGSATNSVSFVAAPDNAANLRGQLNLKNFYVDASANGAKVQMTYFERMGDN